MYQTILFDFDGTLVPSLDLWLTSFQYAVSQYGREISAQTIIDRFYYRDPAEVCAEFDLREPDRFQAHVHDGLTKAYERVEVFEGAREVIGRTRSLGWKVGLVTSSPRKQVAAALARLGLADAFDTIVTGDDITNFKPHPEPVTLALTRLDARPDGALFVGDYLFDIQAGKAAGTRTALFLPDRHRRFYDFDMLRAASPDFVFAEYGELAAHLEPAADPTGPARPYRPA